MKEKDYKKILQYIIKDINKFDLDATYILINKPLVSAICCYKHASNKLTCDLMGLLCDMESDYSDAFLCGITYKDFFTNIKQCIKNNSLSIVDIVPANFRYNIQNRLEKLFSMPLERLLIEADLTND